MPSLDEYRKKRDFTKTAEPEGELIESGQSRFVVQKHQARTLHYDFRLEHGGVLVSWAVPKGPPEATSQRRLAIQTEDHPVDYIDFEGEIAEGEYGAGTVEIWDQGHYDLRMWTEGEIKITLHGQRLEGNYVLIHTDGNRWLLIKERESRAGFETRPASDSAEQEIVRPCSVAACLRRFYTSETSSDATSPAP